LPAPSNATDGSEPKSEPFFTSGGGSGRSTPVNILPPSNEAIARIGSRWISFEPATTLSGSAGLIAIDVSLCDPHSWLASTLLPKESCGPSPTSPVQTGVLNETTWYFENHVAPL
jgi:hypothetical protein